MTDSNAEDSRLSELIAAYEESLDHGNPLDRNKLLAENPNLQFGLSKYFGNHDLFSVFRPSKSSVREFTGRVIDVYKILEFIAEGTYGDVYLGEEQEGEKRKVAVKFLKLQFCSSKILQRFELEREALSKMNHLSIVQVFSHGMTEEGRAYIVMEYVDGEEVNVYCDKNCLSISARLELFVKICEAVQHAHFNQLAHRDLKPSNILVYVSPQGVAVPKIIDFGLAKSLGDPLVDGRDDTSMGDAIGTYNYMSPEQAGSGRDVDTRTDVYSLGATLCLLLTGSRRFPESDKTPKLTIMRRVGEEEFPGPTELLNSCKNLDLIAAQRSADSSELRKLLSGPLAWILRMALDRNPECRYHSPGDFGLDIINFLHDRPTIAGRPTFLTQYRHLERQHRWKFRAAYTVVSVITLWLITSIYVEKRTAKALDRAVAAETRLFESYRESTDDTIRELIASQGQIGPKESAYLKRALDRWMLFASQQGDDQQSRNIRGEGYFQVASIYELLGQTDQALVEYGSSRTIRQQLKDDFPTVTEYQRNLAASQHSLGTLQTTMGKYAIAGEELNAAVETWKNLVEQFPEEPQLRHDLAASHNGCAVRFEKLDNSDAAINEYNLALDQWGYLSLHFSNDPDYLRGLSAIHYNLGNLYRKRGDHLQAKTEYELASEISNKLVERFPSVAQYRSDLARQLHSIGNMNLELGNVPIAQTQHEKALAQFESLVNEFPSVPDYRQHLALAYFSLGDDHRQCGDSGGAIEHYKIAKDRSIELVNKFPGVPDYLYTLSMTHRHLAGIQQGNGDVAQKEYADSISGWEKLTKLAPQNPDYKFELAATHQGLAVLLKNQGAIQESANHLLRAVEVLNQLVNVSPNVPKYKNILAAIHLTRANLYRQQSNIAASLEGYKEAADIWKKLATDFPLVPDYRSNLVTTQVMRIDVNLRAGHIDTAISEAEELVQTGKSHRLTAGNLYNLACFYSVASRSTEAWQDKYANRAMDFLQQAVSAGYNTSEAIAHLKIDPDLAPLTERDDFKRFIHSLERLPEPSLPKGLSLKEQ